MFFVSWKCLIVFENRRYLTRTKHGIGLQQFTCILSLLATACNDGNMPRIHKRFAVGHFMKVKHKLAVQLAEEKASALLVHGPTPQK